MEGTSLSYVKFHDGSTTVSVGEVLGVQSGAETILVEISTVGTATIKFEAKGELGVWRPLVGSKMVGTIVILTETSDIAPFYQFDIVGYNAIRMNVTATSGSPLYINGKVIG